MECPVCYREWDSEEVIPRNLPCGHSYCEEDLLKLFQADASVGPQAGQITCPTCCVEHKLANKSDIYALIKNWAVLQYAETFAKQKKELADAAEGRKAAEATNEEGKLEISNSGHQRNDTTFTGQLSAVRDCSNLGLESGAGNSSLIDGDGVRRRTVDEFMDEEPPKLQHN